MKPSRSQQISRQIAFAGGLVMLFAGCQVTSPNKPGTAPVTTLNGGSQIGGTAGQATNGTSGQAAVQVNTNATLTGQVLDASGAPLAGVAVNAPNGLSTTTDASGKYSLPVVAADKLVIDYSKDGYLARQEFTGVAAGATSTVNSSLAALSKNIVTLDPAKGGTVTSDDGNTQIVIPAGALSGATQARITWMDPMPSSQFPDSYGQLPGPNLVQNADGSVAAMAPLGFASIDFKGGGLAPGAQATVKMKVNPSALTMVKQIGGNIDFNDPTTLQQPCYEYDRSTGLWVNPATSKLEQDPDGTVWFVYILHGAASPAAAPANYHALQVVSQNGVVTGTYNVTVPTYGWVTVRIGGHYAQEYRQTGWETLVKDLYGNNLTGTVKEKSSNSSFDGQGLAGATVHHAGDWFGQTTSSTDGSGSFTIPVGHDVRSLGVSDSVWKGATSTGGGFDMHIPTDGTVKANVMGGSLQATVGGPGGSTIVGGNTFGGVVSRAASRDASISLQAPAAPNYVYPKNATMSGSVPVAGVLDFGVLKIVRDVSGVVVEHVIANSDNANTPHQNDGDGLAGAVVTGLTDSTNGNTSETSANNGAGGGNFGFAFYSDQTPPATLHADYKGFVHNDGPGAPYKIVLDTNMAYKVVLGGTFGSSEVGQTATVKYKVDGNEYTKSVTLGADGTLPFAFVRNDQTDAISFVLESVQTPDMIAIAPFPTATINPGDTSQHGNVAMRMQAGSAKYRSH